MIEFGKIIVILVFVLPVVVYLCVKFGTYAYYKAKEMFKQEHRN
jgi:hypothetical protein